MGYVIVTVVANDADSSDTSHGVVTYSKVSGFTSQLRLISTTGEILIASALDRENRDGYVLEVDATDGDTTVSATVSINVTDINDNTPIFNPVSYR